jgi:DNA-binding MltR family transcriptional regulator
MGYDEIGREIRKGGSLAAVILTVAVIDDVLRAALLYNMIKLSREDEKALFTGNGALASFSARIRVAYAMGIISRKLRADLDRLRELRNEYAHKALRVSLQDTDQDRLIRGLNAISDLPSATSLPTQELLAQAFERVCLFLIMRTSPPSTRADPSLQGQLKALDYSEFSEVKRRAHR